MVKLYNGKEGFFVIWYDESYDLKFRQDSIMEDACAIENNWSGITKGSTYIGTFQTSHDAWRSSINLVRRCNNESGKGR